MRFRGQLAFIIFSAALVFSNYGCRKDIPFGKFNNGAIALTFDDNFIDNWYNYLPVLDSLQIKATFYVSHYHRLNDEQKNKLHIIEAHGHEIAFHTATHPDLVKAVKKKGMAVVIRDEVEKDYQAMQKDGFNVINFAYPFGAYDACLNTALLRTFKSVRCVTNKDNFYKGFVGSSGEQQVYFGVPIDMNAAIDDKKITEFISTAKEREDCLVLFAHQIQKPNAAFYLSLDRIKLIAREATARNMKFVRIKDIE